MQRGGGRVKLAIVGVSGGSHIGSSLLRAATDLGIETIFHDHAEASRGSRLLRAFCWRFLDRRPPRLDSFAAEVVAACARARPDLLIATGMAPLTESALRALRALGIVCVNYSTDDPWNPVQRARWYLRALPTYDIIFTTRRANMEEFRGIGCPDVRYLPFGYDELLFARPELETDAPAHQVLFVGGADHDRIAFMIEFMRLGPPVTLVGGYWTHYRTMRSHALGSKPPDVVSALTAAAKVNLCLMRRANRDGNVMRSFEIGAIGGCMLAEDTPEHREIFGADGETVVYFRSAEQAAARARALLVDAGERARLSRAVRARISAGANTYGDRLKSMLAAAEEYREKHDACAMPVATP